MWLSRFATRAGRARGATLALALALPGLGPGPLRPPAGGPVRIVPPEYRAPGPLPALVFVSRAPLPGGGVPGLGPGGRAAVTGGRLLVRERDGRLRELLGAGAMFDAGDPAVSFDGRRIAFAGVVHPDSAWRIYLVDLEGRNLRAVTRSDRALDLSRLGADAARFERYDDFDPCWIDDRRLCFASTRYPLRAQYADVPATNLFLVTVDGAGDADSPWRITSERNGAEEPALDQARGEIVFSRWWFNRFGAAAEGFAAAAPGPSAPPRSRGARDSVNLWQAIALTADGPRLRCGSVTSRRAMMAYQVCFLPDGTPVATCALNLGLWPRPGPLGLQRFRPRGGPAERIAGAVIPDSAVGGYSEALGLAAPAACSPAALPDGRVVFSYDPGGRGDFGLWVVRPGGTPVELANLPGTLELDVAAIVRRDPPRPTPHVPAALPDLHPVTLAELGSTRTTFDYHSLDLFRAGPSAPGPAPRADGARIRFFAAPLLAPGSAGDTAVLIRELAVGPDGEVDARGLPADVPLFEQLVDSTGQLLRSAHGPAHVAGFNAGARGGRSRCVGCHLGHSALLPRSPRR